MEQLTDYEKGLVAFALFGFTMRTGPAVFEGVECIVNKLDIVKQFEFYGNDWIAYKKTVDKMQQLGVKFPIIERPSDEIPGMI